MIVVTGGAGFIGSNLCHRLIEDGKRVLCIDNLFTGKMENLKSLLTHPKFTFINHDVTNPFEVYPVELQDTVEQIYHLACPASPPKYQIDPIYTLKTNFLGTLNMLELAHKKNATILFSSTSEIYGEPEISPQHEEYRGNVNTIGIRSCYDEGKRVAETLMMEFHNKHNGDIRIARIFNTFGPRMDKDDGRVVSNFINQALRNQPITLYGNGSQTRSFCYIDDTLDGIICLMNSDYKQPVNIGNDIEITVKELSNIILGLIHNSNSSIIYKELPMDDPTNRKPDISRAKNVLGWSPHCDLLTGLKKTIEYFSHTEL